MAEQWNLKEQQCTSEDIFQGKVLHVLHDTVILPNGNTASRELIRHIGAVCVVPLTEDGKVIVVRQYRYPVGEITTEIPAGKLNSREEDPLLAVQRELQEETGATAGKITSLGYFYPACAYSDEKIYMYLAEQLTFGAQNPDDDEFLTVDAVPIETLVAEIQAGNIPDLKTQAAVMRVYCMQQAQGGQK